MATTSTITAVYFMVLGMCFGSFSLATAYRIHKKKKFVRERSCCESCKHVLAPADLVPVFSWLYLRGKCRYCKKPLNILMPLAELLAGFVFASSYLLWPDSLTSVLGITRFLVWCVALVLLLILFFYDLQWYLLPNKLIYPLWAIAGLDFVLRFAQTPSWHTVFFGAMSVLISAGLFFVFYTVSSGNWIGFGDVRLGVAIGLLLAHPLLSGLALFVSSVVGIVAVIPSFIRHKTTLKSKIPYGPLLIVALVIVRLVGTRMIDWYSVHILLL